MTSHADPVPGATPDVDDETDAGTDARTARVGILLFDQVEVLDACGPFEVFSTATRVHARLHPDRPPRFEVVMLATTPRPVVARGGLHLGVHHTLADHPPLDVVLVPGGVTDDVEQDREVLAWLAAKPETRLLASVCTGAFVLAEAGRLREERVTTHWDDVAELRRRHPGLTVLEDVRWVDDGVLTSAGISAGLDLALHLVQRLAGRDVAVGTARLMDYAWVEDDPTG
ncbi:DJ-1/PfpI family protein [Jannaschia sp. R86511]|uniref:DJ-1/PfpI family protein n=1 Tax=Jannaschia sp. R86511 TaxID=3093853 RepID=UPI0036D34AE9